MILIMNEVNRIYTKPTSSPTNMPLDRACLKTCAYTTNNQKRINKYANEESMSVVPTPEVDLKIEYTRGSANTPKITPVPANALNV